MTKSTIEIKREEGRVTINIKNLGIGIKRRIGKNVVYSPGLNVLGYSSKSVKSALKDFEENLELFFAVHLTDDTIREALVSNKWNFVGEGQNFGTNKDNGLVEKDFEISIAA